MSSVVRLLVATGTVALFSSAASAAISTASYRDTRPDPFTGNSYTGQQSTYLDSTDIYGNLGGMTITTVLADSRSSPAHIKRSLFQFDISSMQGHVASGDILGGTLTLYLDPNGYYGSEQLPANPDNTLVVYPIADANAGWQAGTGTYNTPVTQNATWKFLNETSAGAGTSWAGSQGLSTAGTDYDDANPLGTYSLPLVPPITAPIPMTFTVPASLIQHWLSGPNAGVLAMYGNESLTNDQWNQIQIVRDGGYWDYRYYPELDIQYNAPVPEPTAGAVLLIGGCMAACKRRKGS